MRILALDSSTAACSAAIWDSGNAEETIAARRFEKMERGQSEVLAPMVQGVLGDAGMAMQDIDLLAVTTGPGAFTGVRIGLAMARAIGIATSTPVMGISTMTAVAHGAYDNERGDAWTVVVMDTKRDDIYAQVFDPSLAPACEPDIIAPDNVPAMMDCVPDGGVVFIVGDATGRIGPDMSGQRSRLTIHIGKDIILPDAAIVAEIAAGSDPSEQNSSSLAPVYLRPPYAKISPTGGKLRP